MTDTNPIAGRLKRLRERKGLSRREAAGQIGVDVTAVAAWEAGKYLPREGHRAKLAQVLATDQDILFDTRSDPPHAGRAEAVDTMSTLPHLLPALLRQTTQKIQA